MVHGIAQKKAQENSGSYNHILIGATTDCTTKTYFESDENSKGFSKTVKESDLFRENENPLKQGNCYSKSLKIISSYSARK